MFERLPLADFGNRIPQLSFEIVRPVGALEQMVRAVTLIPGTTEFGYEPATVVGSLGPRQSAPENRHVANAAVGCTWRRSTSLQALCPNLERVAHRGGVVRRRSARGPLHDRAAASKAPSRSYQRRDLVGRRRDARRRAYVVSQVDGRPAYGGTPSDDSVDALIGELKARGLKVTLYPFVMMDIPAGNALPDPWSGASSQPAYPWRGRITCDPAPGAARIARRHAAAATQVDAFLRRRQTGIIAA